MSLTLTWLVDRQLRNLTGAQFKLAAYLYRRLQREPELTIRAKDLAEATGLSEKSAQSASNHLAKQNILAVIGGPGTTKTYRLPAAQPAKPGAAKPGGSNTIVRSRRQTAKPAAAPPPPTPEPVTEKPDPKRMPPVVAPPKPEASPAGELPRAPSASSFSAPPAASMAERPGPLPGPERVAPLVAPQTAKDIEELGRKPQSRRKAPKKSRLAKTWWIDAKEAINAELRRRPSTSSSPAPPPAIKVELPAPLPGKPESVAPVVTPPVTRGVIESGRRPEAAGVKQPPKPQPASSTPAPPAAIKVEPKPERPAPPPGKGKRELVESARQAAEAADQQEIEALLAVVFRPVNPKEQDGLEKFAGGKQKLLECLRSFQQRGMSFGRENLDLFRSALANPGHLLKPY
jgi:hypothetical protein